MFQLYGGTSERDYMCNDGLKYTTASVTGLDPTMVGAAREMMFDQSTKNAMFLCFRINTASRDGIASSTCNCRSWPTLMTTLAI